MHRLLLTEYEQKHSVVLEARKVPKVDDLHIIFTLNAVTIRTQNIHFTKRQ